MFLAGYELRARTAGKDGWSAGDVGAKRTWRVMAAAAGQESASLQLQERCRTQRPLRSARWARCEGADLLEHSEGSAASPSMWTGGLRLRATAFPGERAGAASHPDLLSERRSVITVHPAALT